MTDTQTELLQKYEAAVREASETVHLTSAGDLATFGERHIKDAVTMASLIDPELALKPLKAIDVGSGNGVPGIVLAILFPHWRIDLIDSNNKKCLFLDTFLTSHSISNANVLCDRAEYAGRRERREHYDIGFARALGKLPTVLELVTPMLKTGGTLIVPHGTTWEETLKTSHNAMNALKLKFTGSKSYPVMAETFYCLSFIKEGPIEPRFPRNVGVPEKRPL